MIKPLMVVWPKHDSVAVRQKFQKYISGLDLDAINGYCVVEELIPELGWAFFPTRVETFSKTGSVR